MARAGLAGCPCAEGSPGVSLDLDDRPMAGSRLRGGRHHAPARVPGRGRPQQPAGPDGGAVLAGRPRLRGREERPDPGVRRPGRPHAHRVRRPPAPGVQRVGSRAARVRPAPGLPEHAVGVRALHPQRAAGRHRSAVAVERSRLRLRLLSRYTRHHDRRLRRHRSSVAPLRRRPDASHRARARREQLVSAVSQPLDGRPRVRPRRRPLRQRGRGLELRRHRLGPVRWHQPRSDPGAGSAQPVR